eukprot:223194_1
MFQRSLSSARSVVSRQLIRKPDGSHSRKLALALYKNRMSSSSAATHASASSSNYSSPYADMFQTMKKNQFPSFQDSPLEIPELKCGISENVLTFRTTCYDRLMAPPYVHTNEYKVTLQVNLDNLPLKSDLEKKIFRQIVGARFNEDHNKLKMVSNQFASRIENKRHLCWMLDRIVLNSQRLAAEEE